MRFFEQSVKALNLAVFSSANLANKDNRELLKRHLKKWEHEIIIWEETSKKE